MRVFLTGATGFIGGYLIPELLAAGHQVTGLSRSDAGVEALARAGADPVRGDVNDLPRLHRLADGADAVVHAAFEHDFSRVRHHSEADRQVIAALGEALAGSDRPLIVTSGTGLVRSKDGAPVTERDNPAPASEAARAASEEAANRLIAQGLNVMLMRLPQVHDTRRQGRIAQHILLARKHGYVAYVGAGENRVPAAHVSDVARLYRLALEHGQAGARYHAVAEDGVALRPIAEVIGAGLDLPVRSLTPEEAPAYFGVLSPLAALDLAASGAHTRRTMNWAPRGPDFLSDLKAMDWANA